MKFFYYWSYDKNDPAKLNTGIWKAWELDAIQEICEENGLENPLDSQEFVGITEEEYETMWTPWDFDFADKLEELGLFDYYFQQNNN